MSCWAIKYFRLLFSCVGLEILYWFYQKRQNTNLHSIPCHCCTVLLFYILKVHLGLFSKNTWVCFCTPVDLPSISVLGTSLCCCTAVNIAHDPCPLTYIHLCSPPSFLSLIINMEQKFVFYILARFSTQFTLHCTNTALNEGDV